MDIDIVVRAAKQEDLDEVESLYNALNDYLAVHENYPRWKKGIYPLREHAEEGIRTKSLYVATYEGKIIGTVKQNGKIVVKSKGAESPQIQHFWKVTINQNICRT